VQKCRGFLFLVRAKLDCARDKSKKKPTDAEGGCRDFNLGCNSPEDHVNNPPRLAC